MTWLLAPALIAVPFLVLAARLVRGYIAGRRRRRFAAAYWAAKQEVRQR